MKCKRVLFWHHSWFGDVLLKDRFPNIYRISTSASILVEDAWDRGESSSQILTRRLVKDEEIIELANLLSLLTSILLHETEDVWIWSLENSGVFTVSSSGKITAVVSLFPKDVYSSLWNSNCPKRVNILTWILLMGKVNTSEILQKKLPFMFLQPTVCLLCAASGVFQQNVFYSCS